MSARTFHISLKFVLLVGVTAMGIASLAIVAMSATRLQRLSYDNKLSSFHGSGFRALETVRVGAERVRSGSYDKVPETHFHEINAMVSSFNSMAENVANLVEKLDAARLEAERASRAKSTFLANMSHEIRTPMNAILGYAQILDRDQDINPKQRRAVNVIGRSGIHLLELINEVLDISKDEVNSLQHVHQQLANHLQHLLTEFRLDEIVRLTTKVAK